MTNKQVLTRASEMVQLVKELTAKPGGLSLSPRTHIAKGQKGICSFTSLHSLCHFCQTHKINKIKRLIRSNRT